jgi:hypothetical protein
MTISADPKAVAFFLKHAGYSWDSKTETREQGRLRCAEKLARAEAWLAQQPGHQIEWNEDEHADRSGIEHDGPLYMCGVRVPDVGARGLFGIDLGEHGELSDPYTRVVVAELACELMPD